MAEAKHTPGPWHIRYGGMEGDEGFGVASKVEPGIVAECYPCATDEAKRKRLLADARLIAAAPELLESVQNYLSHCEAEWASLGNHPASRWKYDVELLRDLVKRATQG